jgi:hypothetical protein
MYINYYRYYYHQNGIVVIRIYTTTIAIVITEISSSFSFDPSDPESIRIIITIVPFIDHHYYNHNRIIIIIVVVIIIVIHPNEKVIYGMVRRMFIVTSDFDENDYR